MGCEKEGVKKVRESDEKIQAKKKKLADKKNDGEWREGQAVD